MINIKFSQAQVKVLRVLKDLDLFESEAVDECIVLHIGVTPSNRTIKISSYPYFAVLSNGNHFIVSASTDGTLKFWDVETGSLLQTLEGHQNVVILCCLSSDDRFVVSASWDKTLKIWDVETGSLLQTLEGHQRYVNSCCLSSDNRFIVSASRDKTLKIWNVDLE